MSWSMDHASNRYLVAPASPGEGAFVTLNALLTRSSETLQLTIQPSIFAQRFTTGSGADSNDGSINLGAAWSGQRSSLSLTAGYSDLSTAISELETTGVVQANTYQRQATAGSSWTVQQSSAGAQLSIQLNYADVRYVGQYVGLNAYRYPSFSVGEQFNFSTRTSVTIGAAGSEIKSPGGGGTSRDGQLTLSVAHAFSARLQGLATVGFSDLNYGTGSNRGVVGEFHLTRTAERDRWTLLYQRSISPNGFGELVVRDQASFTGSRDLAARLSVSASLLGTRDREVYFFVLQESRKYASIETTLNWRSGESSTVGLRTGYDRAQLQALIPVPTENGWRAALIYTWTPQRLSISR
jgi:hypothetical protein